MHDFANAILDHEARGLEALKSLNRDRWQPVINTLLGRTGKVVVCGLGKSGQVGVKWAASFSSLGTPAVFLHATEALHGDLGVLTPGDVLFLISNSGATQEVVAVARFAKENGYAAVAVTRDGDSPLAQSCTHWLALPAGGEADPNGQAPTTSTTATLALGDVLALLLAREKGFTRQDFAHLHPGGALGQAAREGA